MKKTLIVLAVLLMVFSIEVKGQTRAICESQKVMFLEPFDQCDYNPWVLVFEDNFDGNSLDLTKWDTVYGVARDPEFESQKAWHQSENLEVSDGTLKIIARKPSNPIIGKVVTSWEPYIFKIDTFEYTTGEIWTKHKFSFGKFEARIKIAKGKGFFPAFWLFGNPPWNEIDIFEFWTRTGNIYIPNNLSKIHQMTTHYYGPHNGNSNTCNTNYIGVDFSQDFHIFTLIWEKDKIEWYVDGALKRRDCRYYNTLGQEIGCGIKAYTAYLRNEIYPKDPMAIILNFAIEYGKYEPDNTTPFPSQMEVDWVRYYKKCDCNNKIITHSSQCPLDDEAYNVLVGKNVEINCSYNISHNKQLEVIAKSGITLKPGFVASAGSVFSAKIDPSICDNTYITMVENPEEIVIDDNNSAIYGELFNEETLSLNMKENRFNVKIYPNPNDGSFTVEFDVFLDYGKYALKIMTPQGQTVYSMDKISNLTTTIDLIGRPRGIYFLSIYDKETFEAQFYKIVVL
jgi:beta-glucanase (GH16 family)